MLVTRAGMLGLAVVEFLAQAWTQAQHADAAPLWLRGVWTRNWIEVKGARSNPFVVRYLQTPSEFADLRLPVGRPSFRGAHSFADLSDADLLSLAKQRAFMGHATAVGDTITWHHEIDFQPVDGGADIGRAERSSSTAWYEHALDGSYVESWRSLGSSRGGFLVVRVERAGRLERTLIVVGDRFLFVRNRLRDLPAAPSLDSLIRATRASREQIIAYLDCEFSTGRVRGGRIRWVVEGSTLPWLEGRPLEFATRVSVLSDSPHLNVPADSGERVAMPINTLSRADLASIFPASR